MVAGECCIAYTYSMHRAHVTITLQYVKATWSQTLLFFYFAFSFSFHFYQLLDSSSLYVLNHSLYCITDMAVYCGFFIHPCYLGRRRREWHQYWRQITSILGPNRSHHCSCNLQWHSRRWAFPQFLSRCRCFFSLPWKLIIWSSMNQGLTLGLVSIPSCMNDPVFMVDVMIDVPRHDQFVHPCCSWNPQAKKTCISYHAYQEKRPSCVDHTTIDEYGSEWDITSIVWWPFRQRYVCGDRCNWCKIKETWKDKAGATSCKMMLMRCINRLYCRGRFHSAHCHLFWDPPTGHLFTAWPCSRSLFRHTGSHIDADMVYYCMAYSQVAGFFAWKASRLYVRRFRYDQLRIRDKCACWIYTCLSAKITQPNYLPL